MRRVAGKLLWVGHVGEAADAKLLGLHRIGAMVDLAIDEVPTLGSRERVYCRFPLMDGAGNSPWLIRGALQCAAMLVRVNVPTLIFCGAGMSRSPSIAAGTLALVSGDAPAACLALLTRDGPADVSPGLWNDVAGAVLQMRAAASFGLAEPGPARACSTSEDTPLTGSS